MYDIVKRLGGSYMYDELKRIIDEHLKYFHGTLMYDTRIPYYIDEAGNSVTVYLEANGFPDIDIPVENWNKNGSYTIHILDTPIFCDGSYKPVHYNIRIQKWIDKTTLYRTNSPIINIDASHNATQRAILSLKEEIMSIPTREIRQKYGVSESFVSLLMKEYVALNKNQLEYIRHPEIVECVYITKCFLGDSPIFAMFEISLCGNYVSLIEWEKALNKLLEKTNRYIGIKVLYVDDNSSTRFLNQILHSQSFNTYDILCCTSPSSELLLSIESKNWRKYKRLDALTYANLLHLKNKMKMNRLTAKKDFYRILFSNKYENRGNV